MTPIRLEHIPEARGVQTVARNLKYSVVKVTSGITRNQQSSGCGLPERDLPWYTTKMRAFYLLLANNVVSSITNFTVWFAITYFTYLQTQSVIATSVISGLFLVSTAISGFCFGGLVDRYKKKTMMYVSSIASLVFYLMSFAIYLTAPQGSFTSIESVVLWVFVPITMLGVISGNIRNIVLPTLITILVPEKMRDRANGMAGTAGGISFLIVSVISGFLVGHSGMYWVLILAIVLSLASILHLWFISVPEKGHVHVEGVSHSPVNLDIKGTLKAISSVPGLFALILFTTFNNFIGGVFMSLMDAYGLSLVSVQVWGLIWGVLSIAFIVGGLIIAKWGLGKNPLKTLFTANVFIWTICIFFTIQPSIVFLVVGMFLYLSVVPYIEAAEHTIIQKVVKHERQGRVFGFAQSIEQAASPLTAFAIGPITQLVFIPFMTTGAGVDLIGSWFGTGPGRGIALVFTLTGCIGLTMTLLAMRSRSYALLSRQYVK